jgi:uncharacterized protein (TIGR02453 family)
MSDNEPFKGFPLEALTFYAGLELDNAKGYWEANKDSWERAARDPMRALLATLPERFGPFRLFRPYRDVRFSRDKSPYKTQIAAAGEGEHGATFYLHLSAAGLFVASGYYHLAADQLARFREAVAGPAGETLPPIVAALEVAGHAVGGGMEPPLKRAPRGWPADHPRADLLKLKGMAASRDFGDPPWLHTAEAGDRIVAAWDAGSPLTDWLDRHVGPSRELPPEIKGLVAG